jgi:hypothetical protein
LTNRPAGILTLPVPDRQVSVSKRTDGITILDQTEGFCIENLPIKYEPDLILQMNVQLARMVSFVIHRYVDKDVDKHVYNGHNPHSDSFFSELPEY